MLTSILLLVAAAQTSTSSLALIGEAEARVAGCGLAKVIPKYAPGSTDSPKVPWSVEHTQVGGAAHTVIGVGTPEGDEWRIWMLSPKCKAFGLRIDPVAGIVERLYRLDTPISIAEQGALLTIAGYRKCDEPRPLPELPKLPAPSLEADSAPPAKFPKITSYGPVPIRWAHGPYRDPGICWQSESDPPARETKMKATDFVAGGPRFKWIEPAGFQDGCTGLKGCQPFAITVGGHRVTMLGTLGKPGMSLLALEDSSPRRHAVPFAVPGEAKLLGLYQGYLWVLLPVIKAPNFTLAALDLSTSRMWRVALEPVDDWSLAKTNGTSIFVRNAELQEQYEEAEGSVDKKRLAEKFPSVEVTWKSLAEALPKAR
jgi:hypothetical protein